MQRTRHLHGVDLIALLLIRAFHALPLAVCILTTMFGAVQPEDGSGVPV